MSVMLGSRVSLDWLVEWIELITNNAQRLGAYLNVGLGSNSERLAASRCCPLSPDKLTLLTTIVSSEKCQLQTRNN
jgi:hypothetical protein